MFYVCLCSVQYTNDEVTKKNNNKISQLRGNTRDALVRRSASSHHQNPKNLLISANRILVKFRSPIFYSTHEYTMRRGSNYTDQSSASIRCLYFTIFSICEIDQLFTITETKIIIVEAKNCSIMRENFYYLVSRANTSCKFPFLFSVSSSL